MKFNLLNIEIEIGEWFWITIAEIETANQDRSLLHIERNNGVWKFQFLWLQNNCWVVG